MGTCPGIDTPFLFNDDVVAVDVSVAHLAALGRRDRRTAGPRAEYMFRPEFVVRGSTAPPSEPSSVRKHRRVKKAWPIRAATTFP